MTPYLNYFLLQKLLFYLERSKFIAYPCTPLNSDSMTPYLNYFLLQKSLFCPGMNRFIVTFIHACTPSSNDSIFPLSSKKKSLFFFTVPEFTISTDLLLKVKIKFLQKL